MRKIISKILSQPTKNKLHKVEAKWANLINGYPASRIKVIGVTGTKGKTTVCNMISAVLDESGIKNAMETTINTKIGDKIINVIQPDTIVRNLSFYKDRSDVVMFSTLGSVFVIEIDEKGNQNFMPVYRGQKPLFMKTDSSFIYVLDGEVLMQVVI